MLHSRMKRVAESIKENLGEIIDRRLENPKIPPLVTVLSVKVAKDLRVADISVTFLQDDDEAAIETAMDELQKAAAFIRGELARRISLKYLPALRFHYNPSTRYAAQMQEVFDRIDHEAEPDAEPES